MAGVKKSGSKGGRRNAAPGKTGDRRSTAPGQAQAKRSTAPRQKGRRGSTAPRQKGRRGSTAPGEKILRIRELDPYRKCGAGTSVERLIRVDEEVAGRMEAHLVYYDRHGWYCEHGRTCHAVRHARRSVRAAR